ncbi:MAG TPA: hypothetical protein VLY85_03635, partial [Thermoplasmata archaeon]|nr:hypothetical protein [Thermoplasmata archaeon]
TEITNSSIASDLSVDQILEVSAATGTPRVVAVAFPANLQSFNGSTPAGATLPFDLTAGLAVLPANASLWAGPGATVQPIGAPLGTARLDINYSAEPSSQPGAGVVLNWSVSGWPWISVTDLLGIQLGMSTPSGTGFVACSDGSHGAVSSDCPGTGLAPGGTIWTSSVTGVDDGTGNGSAATVAWTSTLEADTGTRAPVTAGVFAQSPTTGHLLLAAPAGGARQVAGSIRFALLSPTLPVPAPLLVHGETGWFAGSLVAFAAAGSLGWWGYRRRSDRLEREL